jgi:hypothetical protein
MSAEGQIARGGVGEPTVDGTPSEIQSEQYSLAKILGIWALAAAPMGIVGWMGWFVSPLLAPNLGWIPSGCSSRGWCYSCWV